MVFIISTSSLVVHLLVYFSIKYLFVFSFFLLNIHKNLVLLPTSYIIIFIFLKLGLSFFASGDIFINTFRLLFLIYVLFNYTFLYLLYLLILLILYAIFNPQFKLDCIITLLAFNSFFFIIQDQYLYTLIFFDCSSSKTMTPNTDHHYYVYFHYLGIIKLQHLRLHI